MAVKYSYYIQRSNIENYADASAPLESTSKNIGNSRFSVFNPSIFGSVPTNFINKLLESTGVLKDPPVSSESKNKTPSLEIAFNKDSAKNTNPVNYPANAPNYNPTNYSNPSNIPNQVYYPNQAYNPNILNQAYNPNIPNQAYNPNIPNQAYNPNPSNYINQGYNPINFPNPPYIPQPIHNPYALTNNSPGYNLNPAYNPNPSGFNQPTAPNPNFGPLGYPPGYNQPNPNNRK